MSIAPSKAKALLKRIGALRILVIGDVMLDHYIWGDATRISPEAPVPVIDIARDTWTAGGAANVAANIAELGAHCTVFGHFGADEHGARLREILKGKGIEAIAAPGSGTTIVKTRVLVQHQQLCRLDRESSPSSYAVDPAHAASLLSKAIKDCDAVILSDYAKGLLTDGLVARVTKLARAEETFIALDPKPRHPLAFSGLDLITPNRREALQLAGIDPEPAAPFPAAAVFARLHERYSTKNIVVTLGEDGMLLGAAGRVLKKIPTAAREIYDVSGAGDTALAGLVLALTSGAGLEEAAHFANAAAGVVVAKLGTATVSPAELLEHLSRAVNRALFLDRDGTLIVDKVYLSDPAGVELIPGAADGLRRARSLGFKLFLFTNQSGIGRGLHTLEDARRVNARMEEMLGLPAPVFDGTCIAPEASGQPSLYRKPSPRFILEAIAGHSLDPSGCWIVGDSAADVGAAMSAGIRAAAVRTGRVPPESLPEVADGRVPVFADFGSFAATLT